MKFKILVQNSRGEWWETYEEKTDNPQLWAEETLRRFNATLRPGEQPRELLKVEVENEANDNLHDWIKRTDGMSVSFRGRMADLMYCRGCGITGKRYGIGPTIKIDSKYRKAAYRQCHTSRMQQRIDGI